MFARSVAVRLSASVMTGHSRCLSSQPNVALEKLRSLLEEYRMENYAQETRRRFQKEIVKAAVPNGSTVVGVEALQRVLQNIGYSNRLSKQEIESVFKEVGNSSSVISAEHMARLIL